MGHSGSLLEGLKGQVAVTTKKRQKAKLKAHKSLKWRRTYKMTWGRGGTGGAPEGAGAGVRSAKRRHVTTNACLANRLVGSPIDRSVSDRCAWP